MRWTPLLILLLTSCSTPGITRLHFEPNPLEVPLVEPWNLGRVLFSVVSLHTDEVAESSELAIRLRAENQSNTPFRIHTSTMTLLTADLKAFGAPRAEPSPDPLIPPGEASTVTLFFPLPPETSQEELDYSTLNLHWTLEVSGFEISKSANFERKMPQQYYYRPAYVYPYYPFWFYCD